MPNRSAATQGGAARKSHHPAPAVEVSVVVVCRDDEERVGHLVRRLHAHLAGLGRSAEIIVVDEHSSDNTLPVLALMRRELPELTVVAGVAPGRGYQRGAERASGTSLLLIDARCDSPLSALGFALGAIDRGVDAMAVQGRYAVLRRTRSRGVLAGVSHRREPADLHHRLLRRCHRFGLRVEQAGGGLVPAHPLARLRDAILLPLATRAWW